MDWSELEDKVGLLRPDLHGDKLRELALLFAILKVGPQRLKIQALTRYDTEMIEAAIQELREHHQLVTGALHPRFVLEQLPGSEDLIEEMTGIDPRKSTWPVEQPVIVPPANHERNGMSEELCKCGKKLRHIGACRGEARGLAKRRAKAIAPPKAAKLAKAPNAPNGSAAKEASGTATFAIYYSDGETTLDFKGTGLNKFIKALEMLGQVGKEAR